MVSDLEGALSHGVAEGLVSADALGDRFQQVSDRPGHELGTRRFSKLRDKVTQPDGGRSEFAHVVLGLLVSGTGIPLRHGLRSSADGATRTACSYGSGTRPGLVLTVGV